MKCLRCVIRQYSLVDEVEAPPEVRVDLSHGIDELNGDRIRSSLSHFLKMLVGDPLHLVNLKYGEVNGCSVNEFSPPLPSFDKMAR